METCKIQIINESANPLPAYQSKLAAGMDLYASNQEKITLEPGDIKLIPTGIRIAIPEGYEVQIRARSGLALKHGLSLVNGIGTIDGDYRGEIKVIIVNLGKKAYTINFGERIAQMVVKKYVAAKFELVDLLEETERGEGGFGHSGHF
jgi:dUTP pyrophosphatase